jgi:hypothetical protein
MIAEAWVASVTKPFVCQSARFSEVSAVAGCFPTIDLLCACRFNRDFLVTRPEIEEGFKSSPFETLI